MLKVLPEEDLIWNITSSNAYRLDVTDRLMSNMILYTVVESYKENQTKYLVYRRPHKDSSFHNKWSVGVGGSMELSDLVSLHGHVEKHVSLIASGVRELNEELTLTMGEFTKEDISLIGYIDGHLKAIVGHVRVPPHIEVIVNEPENEGLGWYTLDELIVALDNFEPWSQYVIEGLTYLTGQDSFEATAKTTWRSIPGYKRYEVNAAGELRNKKTSRVSKGGDAGRYLKVSVYPDGADEPHLEYLHILVCKAFHGMPSKGQVVLHKNNIRSDVRPANLEWGTQSDNITNAHADGLIGQ